MASDASAKSVQELRQFERDLQRYQDSLVQSTNEAIRAMNRVNEGWNDKVQAKFMEQFSQALKGIQQMAALVDERKKSVHKSADILEEYLRNR